MVKSAREIFPNDRRFIWMTTNETGGYGAGYVTGDYDGVFVVAKQRASCLHNTSTVLIGQEGGRRPHSRLFHGDAITLIISACWLLTTCGFPNYEWLFLSRLFSFPFHIERTYERTNEFFKALCSILINSLLPF